MNRKEKLSPDNFPFILPVELGDVKMAMEEIPNVFYISLVREDDIVPGMTREYYVVPADSPLISREAGKYGQRISGDPELILYSFDDPQSGHYIIAYEIEKYRVQHQLEPGEGILAASRFAAEYHPEYFGNFPAPLETPWGQMTRYRELDGGVFWLETETAAEGIAICYPVWDGDCSDYVKKLAAFTERDTEQGIDKTLGYAFYTMQDACLPLFELYEEMERIAGHVDYRKLMNAVWKQHPDFAASWNIREVSGRNSLSATLFDQPGLGESGGSEKTIAITPEADDRFLKI